MLLPEYIQAGVSSGREQQTSQHDLGAWSVFTQLLDLQMLIDNTQ